MQRAIDHIKKTLEGLYPDGEINAFSYLIINHLRGYSKGEMIINRDKLFSTDEQQRVYDITQKLARYEPIQYILGETIFYGLPFAVSIGVLIPRFETEELVDLIISENRNSAQLKIIDLGTGSGCIAVSLKKNLPDSQVWACDLSEKALGIASKNAMSNNCDVHFFLYDILGTDMPDPSGFDILVSNPPYVTLKEKALMPENVLNHEPYEALFVPDNDPLLFYRAILEKSETLLKAGGRVYFEINEAYGQEMLALMESFGFDSLIITDINGKVRIAKGRK
ncbi:MAG TPA: peptide chain release factor N(5)-glutamine methyltransferase [Prolixibacteraceae bacterium]|nr:peptide chain release factor N(5)-glutamine methyltransferase [Prolixibacteraceae bacterium]